MQGGEPEDSDREEEEVRNRDTERNQALLERIGKRKEAEGEEPKHRLLKSEVSLGIHVGIFADPNGRRGGMEIEIACSPSGPPRRNTKKSRSPRSGRRVYA